MLWKSISISKHFNFWKYSSIACISVDDDVHPKEFLESPIAYPETTLDATRWASPATDFDPPPISNDNVLTKTLPNDYIPPVIDFQPSSTVIPLPQSTWPRNKLAWSKDFVSVVVYPEI